MSKTIGTEIKHKFITESRSMKVVRYIFIITDINAQIKILSLWLESTYKYLYQMSQIFIIYFSKIKAQRDDKCEISCPQKRNF